MQTYLAADRGLSRAESVRRYLVEYLNRKAASAQEGTRVGSIGEREPYNEQVRQFPARGEYLMLKSFAAGVADSRISSSTGGSASLMRGCGIALLGSFAVAVAAHVAVPLPFTPVPLTLQPFAVLLVGLLCGPQLGFATMLAYLAEGAAGLPVFQPHGPGGLLQLMGPTGGFLWSYPLVAMVAGALFRGLPFRSRFAAALLACSVAVTVLFAAGATQLAAWTHLSGRGVLLAAVVPFLPGEAIKVLAASGIAAAWSQRARR